ncbi:MAG: rane protein [Herbinix sp.]|nr:rane protein [Herbinix sp.]
MNLKERALRIKTDIPAVFIALKRKDTPLLPKIIAGITIVYALSPIDLIPDFIPVLGYLDDLIILPALIALTIKFLPEEILQSSRLEAEGLWSNGKPKRWCYAMPIIILWVIVLLIIIKTIVFI